MATIRQTPSGGYEIRFRLSDGRRPSYYTGAGVDFASAHAIGGKLDRLVAIRSNGREPTGALFGWVEFLDDDKHARLASWGLVAPRVASLPAVTPHTADRSLLGPFLKSYIAGRTDVAQSTRDNYGHARRLLVERFGADTPLAGFNYADAQRWKCWLKSEKKQAEATTSKHIKNLKMMLDFAVNDGLIAANPFEKLPAGSQLNAENDYILSDAETIAGFAAMTCQHFRLIFALGRWGGMRPCEIKVLRWSDIEFDENRIRIDSPKTGLRYCPLWMEIRQQLSGRSDANDGHLIGRYHTSQIGTLLRKRTINAGLKPWPRTMDTLRTTRRNELETQGYRSTAINHWVGHSQQTADRSYSRVTTADWNQANTANPKPELAPPTTPPATANLAVLDRLADLMIKTTDIAISQTNRVLLRKNPLAGITGQRVVSYPART